MKPYAINYGSEENRDMYGTPIWKGEIFFLFENGNDIVLMANIYEYMQEKHSDVFIQSYDDDSALIEYLKENYECEVYKK